MKHNEANGENNNDGSNDNFSWNCGNEGDGGGSGVSALRQRQVRNFMTVLMISQGTPMMVMGECLRACVHACIGLEGEPLRLLGCGAWSLVCGYGYGCGGGAVLVVQSIGTLS